MLTGTGTAGAYHAGVLRALHEAGVKLDIVAGRGIGAVGALFTAIDAAARLWEPNGLWLGKSGRPRSLRMASVWRVAGWSSGRRLRRLVPAGRRLLLGSIAYPILLLLELIAPSSWQRR